MQTLEQQMEQWQNGSQGTDWFRLRVEEPFGRLSQTRRNLIIRTLARADRQAVRVFTGTFDHTSGQIAAIFTDRAKAGAAALDIECRIGYCRVYVD